MKTSSHLNNREGEYQMLDNGPKRKEESCEVKNDDRRRRVVSSRRRLFEPSMNKIIHRAPQHSTTEYRNSNHGVLSLVLNDAIDRLLLCLQFP